MVASNQNKIPAIERGVFFWNLLGWVAGVACQILDVPGRKLGSMVRINGLFHHL